MLSFISFILVCIGCINWFCIGILQFDFVAGIFGSQSNIFSRLIYTLVGIAAIIVIANFITNKGKFVVSFKKADKEFEEMKEEKKLRRKALATESAEDFHVEKEENEDNDEIKDCNCHGDKTCNNKTNNSDNSNMQS